LTICLPRDDAPVSGRLLDLEGRPVAGATVRLTTIAAPPGGDLTPFLNAARDSKVRIYELQSKHLSKQILPGFQPIPGATTGPDGRFVMHGIGRERQVEVVIEGPSIRSLRISVLTRPGPPIDIVDLYRKKAPWIERFYGAPFELNLAPSRPYEGVVRDRDTGQPIAGVKIESFKLADSNILNSTLIKTTTDKDGRFRLTGMPLGVGNEVVLTPPDDQPYLNSQYKLPDSGGLKPIPIDLTLKRGIWLQGKISDKSTGKPVDASLRYSAAVNNSHIDEVPGFRDLFYNGNDRGRYFTKEDGTYRIPVLPGAGLITVGEMGGETAYAIDESAGPKPNEASYRPYPYDLGVSWAEVNVGESPASRTRDFVLRPAESRTVSGEIFDEQGKPLTGAR